eukprot:13569861-Ditylum_brightwellii.AAC.1
MEGTEEIGESAFRDCVGLKELELPSTIKNIGGEVFDYCDSLAKVTLPLLPLACNQFRKNRSLAALTFLPSPDELQVEPLEGNTLLHACVINKHPLIHIADIIKEYPNAIRQKNTLGQTPLHLCLSNNVGMEVTKVIYDAWPEAVFARNELNKTPLDYWCENGGDEEVGDIIEAQ